MTENNLFVSPQFESNLSSYVVDFSSIDNYLDSITVRVRQNFVSLLNLQPASCPQLQQALEYTLLSNGKRLRPALIYSLSKTSNSLIDICALAVELIHTYSLVHDDLPAMDNDDMRRGQPSCHKQFNEATAILVGDALQSMAFTLLSNPGLHLSATDSSKMLQVIQVISKAIGHQGMVAGQSVELSSTNLATHEANFETINKIHYLKTGKLITASLQIAAIIHDFSADEYQTITKLGDKLGLAFQIQDDILDVDQTSAALGKPAHSDAKRNLPTYATLTSKSKVQDILKELWSDCYCLINKLQTESNQPFTTLTELVNHIAARQY